MPRLTGTATPKYRRHKATGQAVVSIGGRDHYLGPHGTKGSKLEYDRLIGEWLAAGRQPLQPGSCMTVDEVLARYWEFAESHYRKHGEPTRELEGIRYALRPLQALYGHTLAQAFGPLALKTVQRQMIDAKLCRNVINQRTGKIKRAFRWAASEELIPITVYQGLATVAGLRKGRTDAKERERVKPVADQIVEATLKHLPPVIADMVRFQRLTGCRPEDVRNIRPIDLERSGAVWEYRPSRHKMEHHHEERIVFVGPQAQAVLRPYLLREESQYCFSPADSEANRKAELRLKRKTRVQPSQRDRRNPNAQRKPGMQYTRYSYPSAIRQACKRGNLPHWSPNQLRHASGTKLRRLFGIEAAQVVLGHSRADVTQVYAERDMEKAKAIIAQVG